MTNYARTLPVVGPPSTEHFLDTLLQMRFVLSAMYVNHIAPTS